MPRFLVERGANGVAKTQSVRPPSRGPGPPPARRQRAVDDALSSRPPLLEKGPPRAEAPKRRRIVREGGEIRIEGGPGPAVPAGFDEILDDPLGDETDEQIKAEFGESSTEPDEDDLSDITAANAATAEARAEAAAAAGVEAEAETAAPPPPPPVVEKFPCPADGCDFAAVTKTGLKAHQRAHHPEA